MFDTMAWVLPPPCNSLCEVSHEGLSYGYIAEYYKDYPAVTEWGPYPTKDCLSGLGVLEVFDSLTFGGLWFRPYGLLRVGLSQDDCRSCMAWVAPVANRV